MTVEEAIEIIRQEGWVAAADRLHDLFNGPEEFTAKAPVDSDNCQS